MVVNKAFLEVFPTVTAYGFCWCLSSDWLKADRAWVHDRWAHWCISERGFTVGTVQTGPKAWGEVFAPASAPGVLAPDRTGSACQLVQQATFCCCGWHFPIE